MEVELLEIKQFLAQYPPFTDLPDEVLSQISLETEISYIRKGDAVVSLGEAISDFFVVRSGVVEISKRNGSLFNRLDEGAVFGQLALLSNGKVMFPAKAIEDCLLYCIPAETFQNLYDSYDSFADFVAVEDSTRLRQTIANTDDNDLTTAKITAMINRPPSTISEFSSIRDAAIQMDDENTSCLLVVDDEANSNDKLRGILTDRDLCTRVVAQGVSPDDTVKSVMTQDVITLDSNAYVYEAMLTMQRFNVHHLPILRKNKPIGVIEASDIVRYESQNSLLLVSSIFQQNSVDDLVTLSEQVNDSFVRLVNEDANSHMVGSAMAIIGKSFKQRIIELAEEELGPSPVPYCFLALGSMARDEQLIVTDQDNAIILSNSFDKEKHDEYFATLAQMVSDGLDRCGYPYCTGDIMATNPIWRMTQTEWEECFADWIDDPNAKALLNASIFFDLVGVHGQIKWAEKLNRFITERAKNNSKFLYCLARNALNRTPPLGFFKSFVMEKDGKHKNSINLKRRGTAPLADLIRVHALAVGSTQQNSFERLDDILDAGILPRGRAQDLKDALEFISLVRIRHQAIDISEEREPDNNIEPENLSDFERRNLKDAFQILSNAQNFLKFRYQGTSLK
ncbi:putative nucleotidyltransferase substrate binding domain-containing protein [Vibrio breoganii]|uniref:Cyclic nucleotide-binding protein n=1 Tax=Vibrio breoganii TaxID=553239 RepID=A0AAP8MSX1_9VIBR|nr:putative nucleotidyltransferase substrate binding domain-containing protein [Vibrio breoganii]PMF73432.1 cyclic nucleotide-binding protein [Vibrio breoganii]PMH13402.1 cyclic nucleotide-binding protein [Vibrio breoganii]PMM17123.1 cyclic nucleotide-binding protein [Vibrio breoganii]PMP06512.1 cyclic nucleotide-binding protein [Vibrio breoganii]PMP08614.1 cyclic nucleotide-binding protein [Vibrio breoganii]